MRSLRRSAVVLVVALGTFGVAAGALGATAPTASAFNPLKPVCSVLGFISGVAGKVCGVVQHAGRIWKAGKKLIHGHVGSAVKTFLGSGGGSAASTATKALGLAAVVTWVLGGAKYALHETANILGATTSPQLSTTWFSSAYWQMSGMALLLTLPFLFAAAVQAVLRSDLALLARAALGYLPLAMLAVTVAAPLTMLLLSASDQMSSVVNAASGNDSASFLTKAGVGIGGFTAITGSPFLAFLVGVFTVAGTVVLWVELLMREAAVYVIVLMLPLAFAALVWPARRVWAIRAVELLVALIVSKFVIVAVLALGGAALDHASLHSVAGMLAGFVLVVMAAFAPWALLRLLPLAELASGAAGSLRGELLGGSGGHLRRADGEAISADEWATSTTSQMRQEAEDASDTGPATAARDNVRPNERTNPLPAMGTVEASVEDAADPAQSVAPVHETAGAARRGGGSERLPGLDDMWQAEDLSWEPLTLGLDDGWPPRVWTDQPDISTAPEEPGSSDPGASGEPTSRGTSERERPTGEDRDPRPDPQDSQGGRI